MLFVTNHDENAWNGTVFERHGENAEAMTVVASTLFGMPLIYSGQEVPLRKRLRFFEKDTVEWGDLAWAPLFASLHGLKAAESALWNGAAGAWPRLLSTEHDGEVFAYERYQEGSKVVVAANLSDRDQVVTLPNVKGMSLYNGTFEVGDAAGRGTIPAHGFAIWTGK